MEEKNQQQTPLQEKPKKKFSFIRIFLMVLIFVIVVSAIFIIYGEYSINKNSEVIDKQTCDEIGGWWARDLYCIPPTNDGGKECNDNSQCESGFCLYNERDYNTISPQGERWGKCYGYEHPLGCMPDIKNGVSQMAIDCYD
ncbi:MAG: hypothetical protein WC373_06305 [Smithella sp.]|jgi:hypothetical protein